MQPRGAAPHGRPLMRHWQFWNERRSRILRGPVAARRVSCGSVSLLCTVGRVGAPLPAPEAAWRGRLWGGRVRRGRWCGQLRWGWAIWPCGWRSVGYGHRWWCGGCPARPEALPAASFRLPAARAGAHGHGDKHTALLPLSRGRVAVLLLSTACGGAQKGASELSLPAKRNRVRVCTWTGCVCCGCRPPSDTGRCSAGWGQGPGPLPGITTKGCLPSGGDT
jgi:hypothetical protein